MKTCFEKVMRNLEKRLNNEVRADARLAIVHRQGIPARAVGCEH